MRNTSLALLPTGRVSLFCFTYMLAQGHELSLVRTQLANGASIFACDKYTVLSDSKTWLTPGPPVRIDTEPLRLRKHLPSAGVLVAVWQQIVHDGHFKHHHWSVKVEPDAVFMPTRLQHRVARLTRPHLSAMFLLNCEASHLMVGALQVLSMKAAELFGDGAELCQEHFAWHTMGASAFAAACLRFLGARSVEAYDMLDDAAYCKSKNWGLCDPSVKAVVYHPFKSPEAYFKCWGAQQGVHDKSREESLLT